MKTFQEILETFSGQIQQGNRISRQYGADIKLVPDGNGGYRKVRARAVTWKLPGDPSQIDAPEVGDDPRQDEDESLRLFNKYYKKLASIKQSSQNIQKKQMAAEEYIEEAIQQNIEQMLPYILLLKRKNVRLYPDGLRVALYHNEKLNKFFTVPFGKNSSSVVQAEEYENILKLLECFSKLNQENRESLLRYISNSEENYNTFKNFIMESYNETD